MNIELYDLIQDDKQHPTLICEDSHTYEGSTLSDPESITRMLNMIFKADQRCEEHLYLIALNAACEPLGIFDVAHGTQVSVAADPHAIYTRCILAGAATCIVAHPHPSGNVNPSKTDETACAALKKSGDLLKVPLADFIITGKGDNFYSFHRAGKCCLN